MARLERLIEAQLHHSAHRPGLLVPLDPRSGAVSLLVDLILVVGPDPFDMQQELRSSSEHEKVHFLQLSIPPRCEDIPQ